MGIISKTLEVAHCFSQSPDKPAADLNLETCMKLVRERWPRLTRERKQFHISTLAYAFSQVFIYTLLKIMATQISITLFELTTVFQF